jgi:HEPN domain-containing protein
MVINELYIDSRYPADLGLLPNGRPSVDEAGEFLLFAEGIYESVVELVK